MLRAARATGAAFLYSDEALFEKDPAHATVGHFKPDFAPDYLNCCNYICHFAVFSREMFWQAGGLDPACDGSQDHDLFLKLSERCAPVHVPRVLYFWRVHAGSTSAGTQAKPYVAEAAKRAIAAHLAAHGRFRARRRRAVPLHLQGRVRIPGAPLVSILIPNKDHADDLDRALRSVYEKTDYAHFEVIVIENNSTQKETVRLLRGRAGRARNLRVVRWDGPFNFSAINNFGRRHAKGEYLLLLNNDVEVQNGAWLREMLSLCCQPGVGIVGAKLLYPDGTVQHAGVVTGLGGFAGHQPQVRARRRLGLHVPPCHRAGFLLRHRGVPFVPRGRVRRRRRPRRGLAVAFNDVDFCLRVRKAGWRVVYTPYAQLTHYESKSRGLDEKGEAKRRFDGERARLEARYTRAALTRDPYYIPHLTLDREDFSESDVLPRYEALGCAAQRAKKSAPQRAQKMRRAARRKTRRAQGRSPAGLRPAARGLARGRPCDGENAVRAGRVEARRGRVLLCLRRARAGHLAHSAPRPRRGASACACRCARAAR